MPQLYHPGVFAPPAAQSLQQQHQHQLPIEPRLLSMIHNQQQQFLLQQQQQEYQYLQQQQQQLRALSQAVPSEPSNLSVTGQPALAVQAHGTSTDTHQRRTETLVTTSLTGDVQQPPPQEQLPEQPATDSATASFQGISQRLDDDTIDFITRLPFP
jgi:hypothetical protein